MGVLEALWFFLPILVANQAPGIAVWLDLPFAKTPANAAWLGQNKTLGAYYAGPVGGLVTVYLQRYLHCPTLEVFNYQREDLWLVGLVLGMGAVFGDHAKSFVKRRVGLPPGTAWWPFDQLDFAIGGIVMSIPLIGWIGWERVLIIVIFTLLIHPIGNWAGYRLGLRKVPW